MKEKSRSTPRFWPEIQEGWGHCLRKEDSRQAVWEGRRAQRGRVELTGLCDVPEECQRDSEMQELEVLGRGPGWDYKDRGHLQRNGM